MTYHNKCNYLIAIVKVIELPFLLIHGLHIYFMDFGPSNNNCDHIKYKCLSILHAITRNILY